MLVINPSMRRFTPNLNTYVMTVLLETIHDLKERFKNLGYALLTGIQNSSLHAHLLLSMKEEISRMTPLKQEPQKAKSSLKTPGVKLKNLSLLNTRCFFAVRVFFCFELLK